MWSWLCSMFLMICFMASVALADPPEGMPSNLGSFTVLNVPAQSEVHLQWEEMYGGYTSGNANTPPYESTYWTMTPADSNNWLTATLASLTFWPAGGGSSAWLLPITSPGVFDWSGVTVDYLDPSLEASPPSFLIPEPAAVALLAAGSLLLFSRKYNRRSVRLLSVERLPMLRLLPLPLPF